MSKVSQRTKEVLAWVGTAVLLIMGSLGFVYSLTAPLNEIEAFIVGTFSMMQIIAGIICFVFGVWACFPTQKTEVTT